MMMNEIAISLAGLGVGALVGLTGVGGGAVMTPLLMLVFAVSPQTAVGTDLMFAATTKSVGALSHSMRGTIDWIVVRRLLCGSLPATVLTLLLLHSKALTKGDDRMIVVALASALIVTSLAMIFKPRLHDLGARLRVGSPAAFKRFQPGLTVVAGAIIGVLVTLTSIGAGALGVVVLTYLYPLRLTPSKLVGTDIAHAIPLALAAGVGHFAMSHVDFRLLGWLLLGSIPGVVAGSALSARIPAVALRTSIAILLVVVGIRLLA